MLAVNESEGKTEEDEADEDRSIVWNTGTTSTAVRRTKVSSKALSGAGEMSYGEFRPQRNEIYNRKTISKSIFNLLKK